ncbi:MAG: response regulator [Chitinivibrionia bacterium]|nr:response regulator [Chitinivibrionia bacterium]
MGIQYAQPTIEERYEIAVAAITRGRYTADKPSLWRLAVSAKRVLIIEDEVDIGRLIAINLEGDGFESTIATTGEKGLTAARDNPPDLVLLDWMLPGISGLEVCRVMRSDQRTKEVPIIMLTAKGEEIDMVAGLEVGADDYITKPFSPRVLLARVHAVLRRRAEAVAADESSPLSRHGIAIDIGRHDVRVKGRPVELTQTEFRLLVCLIRRPGWVFSRAQLVDGIRGEDVVVTDRTIDVHVAGLRKKLMSRSRCASMPASLSTYQPNSCGPVATRPRTVSAK